VQRVTIVECTPEYVVATVRWNDDGADDTVLRILWDAHAPPTDCRVGRGASLKEMCMRLGEEHLVTRSGTVYPKRRSDDPSRKGHRTSCLAPRRSGLRRALSRTTSRCAARIQAETRHHYGHFRAGSSTTPRRTFAVLLPFCHSKRSIIETYASVDGALCKRCGAYCHCFLRCAGDSCPESS
jgi:hypothetical protein